jgi:ADP-ribose pyrophosphatase YjhB (NUDIX family)
VLAVNVAVLEGADVLLLQREDFEVWCLPGGEVDPGESLAEAAVRETREETGLDVELHGVVGTYSRPNWHSPMHVVLFTAVPVGGELRLDPAEAVAAGWFAPDALPVPLLLGQRERIDDAVAGRRGVARSTGRRSPFASRAEAYRLRDESGLQRAEFYVSRFGPEDGEPPGAALPGDRPTS